MTPIRLQDHSGVLRQIELVLDSWFWTRIYPWTNHQIYSNMIAGSCIELKTTAVRGSAVVANRDHLITRQLQTWKSKFGFLEMREEVCCSIARDVCIIYLISKKLSSGNISLVWYLCPCCDGWGGRGDGNFKFGRSANGIWRNSVKIIFNHSINQSIGRSVGWSVMPLKQPLNPSIDRDRIQFCWPITFKKIIQSWLPRIIFRERQ